MACVLTQNYVPKDCKEAAGVVSYYLTPFSNMLTAVLTSNVVTAITKTVAWKKYSQEPEIADWKYTGASDGKNLTYAYDWEANFQTWGLNTLDQDELELLMKNKLVLIAEMADGTFWMLGRTYGGHVVSDAFESGVAFGDFRGSKVGIKGRSSTKMVKVDSTIIAALLV